MCEAEAHVSASLQRRRTWRGSQAPRQMPRAGARCATARMSSRVLQKVCNEASFPKQGVKTLCGQRSVDVYKTVSANVSGMATVQ